MKAPIVYWIDLFCGAGGTTTGIHMSEANAKVIACVNHDEYAIASHKANHPDCKHFTEDIRDFEVVEKLKVIVDNLREEQPDCFINIWASLECTNFSIAKGGLPRDADSRTLANHLFMYLEELNPDYLYIENVKEFKDWGPMEQASKVIDGKVKWKSLAVINGKVKVKAIWEDLPYVGNESYYQERNLRPWLTPIKAEKGKYFKPWVRKIKSFGYQFDQRMLNAVDYDSVQSRLRFFGVFAKHGLFIEFPQPTNYDPKKTLDVFNESLKPHRAVKEVLDFSNLGVSIFENPKVDNTLKRIKKGLDKYREKPSFFISYYGNGSAHSVDEPCPTVTTKDRFSLHWISYDYKSFTATSIEEPIGTLTTVPKCNLVTAWITDTQYSRVGKSVEEPCFTLIARMDKKPPYLISSIKGPGAIEIKSTDTEFMKELKAHCIANGIVDIRSRMFTLEELKLVQGLPKEYILKGTIADQKKQIGNAVDTNIAKAMIESNYNAITQQLRKAV